MRRDGPFSVSEVEMTPERKLWQAVVLKAFADATAVKPVGEENIQAKRDARRWINFGLEDYRTACSLAGIDPDFARDAFRRGRVDGTLLRAHHEKREIA